MRNPNSVTYDLGHWESMEIAAALDIRIEEYRTSLAYASKGSDFETATNGKIQSLQNLRDIFAHGTHSVTKRVDD